MDIDLRLPSGEHDEEEETANGIVNLLDSEAKLHNGDVEGMAMAAVEEKIHPEYEGDMNSPIEDMVDLKEDVSLEPLAGMEFESHGTAYSFYQEYARSVGFNTAIQNSRRSKTSREFIDAKFACSRYGTKREYEKSLNRPRSRQGSKHGLEGTTGRRSCAKTDCKASMHVKRRQDGKWIIHRFVKEHNHELLPAQAISEQTRKMYAAMAKQFAEYKSVIGLKSDSKSPFEKGRNMTLEVGETNNLIEFFIQMQTVNSNFFYGVEVGEDNCVRNFIWVDAKSRHDYIHFCDVLSFDTTYIRSKYKMPLCLFVGVNQHYQFILLGCALITDESAATFSWVLQTWLKAMGGKAPKVVITDQDEALKAAVVEVFPSARHIFCLWHVIGKVSETLNQVIKQNRNFMKKFEKCLYRSWTDEEFEKRWQKLVDRFELGENELFKSLYEDRAKWVPTYMKNFILAGMSSAQRYESVNSFFDKYLHKKTTVLEFVKQYEAILQDRYEEEAKADSDSCNKHPTLKSPSPFEKHASVLYTYAMFRKFQVEVLGAVACMPKRERQDGTHITFKVQDFEKNQEFMVSLDESKLEICCLCHLFEFKGFLCRHALIVLQICGISAIPSQYVLKRWAKDAKGRHSTGESSDHLQSRLQRYNNLCERAMTLGEEGSLSQESYIVAIRALDEALGSCVNINNSSKNVVEASTSVAPGLLCIEEDSQSRVISKSNKKNNLSKKRKVNSEQEVLTVGAPESLQPMDKMSSRHITYDGYLCPQQSVQDMVQLNLMAPTRDSDIYGNPETTIQGLGQLNSIPSGHDWSQPSMHGLGEMNFFRSPGFTYGIREEPNVRSAQLHDDVTRH